MELGLYYIPRGPLKSIILSGICCQSTPGSAWSCEGVVCGDSMLELLCKHCHGGFGRSIVDIVVLLGYRQPNDKHACIQAHVHNFLQHISM